MWVFIVPHLAGYGWVVSLPWSFGGVSEPLCLRLYRVVCGWAGESFAWCARWVRLCLGLVTVCLGGGSLVAKGAGLGPDGLSSMGSIPPAPWDTPSYLRFRKAEFPDGVGPTYSKSSSIDSETSSSVLAARAIKQIDWSANLLCDDYLNANTLPISIVQREYCESFSKTLQHDETRDLHIEESD